MFSTFSSHQLSFAPWIGFWQKVACSNVFDLAIYDRFNIRSWQHFSHIGSPSKPKRWGLDIASPRTHDVPLVDVRVTPCFADRLLEEFECEYKDAPYFNEVMCMLARSLTVIQQHDSLWLINLAFVQMIMDWLDIPATLVVGPPKGNLSISSSIATFCRACGCEVYVSGPHGKNYLDLAQFDDRGVKVLFQDTSHLYPSYKETIFATVAKHGTSKTRTLIHDLRTTSSNKTGEHSDNL